MFQVLGGEHGFMMVWIVRLFYINRTLAMGLDADLLDTINSSFATKSIKRSCSQLKCPAPAECSTRGSWKCWKNIKKLGSETYVQETCYAKFADISDTNEQWSWGSHQLKILHPSGAWLQDLWMSIEDYDEHGAGLMHEKIETRLEQWKKTWLVGLYKGWNPTQLYRDYKKPL